jgi:hypothetical protein
MPAPCHHTEGQQVAQVEFHSSRLSRESHFLHVTLLVVLMMFLLIFSLVFAVCFPLEKGLPHQQSAQYKRQFCRPVRQWCCKVWLNPLTLQVLNSWIPNLYSMSCETHPLHPSFFTWQNFSFICKQFPSIHLSIHSSVHSYRLLMLYYFFFTQMRIQI